MNKKKDNNKLTDDVITAVYSHNIEFVEAWMADNDINSCDNDKRTAFFHAVLAGSKEVFQLILNCNPELNTKDKKGWYPLHYAAQNYSVELASLLIQHGADVEVRDDYGNTPLWRATFASGGKGAMIKLLLDNGADKENANDSNVSPVKLAFTIANYDVRQFF
jgi:ankyrin repeat protein